MQIDPTQLRGAANALRAFLGGHQGPLAPSNARLCFDTRGEGDGQHVAIFGAIHPTLAFLVGFLATAAAARKPLSFHREGEEYSGLRASLLEAFAEARESGLVLPGTPFVLPDEFGLPVADGALDFDDGQMSVDDLDAALENPEAEATARDHFLAQLQEELSQLLADAEELANLLDVLDEYAQPQAGAPQEAGESD